MMSKKLKMIGISRKGESGFTIKTATGENIEQRRDNTTHHQSSKGVTSSQPQRSETNRK